MSECPKCGEEIPSCADCGEDCFGCAAYHESGECREDLREED